MKQFREPLRHVAHDCYAGFLLCTQNSLAFLGLAVLCVVALAVAQPQFGHSLLRLVQLSDDSSEQNVVADEMTLPESALKQIVGGARALASRSTALLGFGAEE